MTGPLEAIDQGRCRLYLSVQPKASRNAVEGLRPDAEGRMRLRIRITTAPTDGKANKAVIDLLARETGLPRRAFEITTGTTSRRKCLTVATGMDDLHSVLFD